VSSRHDQTPVFSKHDQTCVFRKHDLTATNASDDDSGMDQEDYKHDSRSTLGASPLLSPRFSSLPASPASLLDDTMDLDQPSFDSGRFAYSHLYRLLLDLHHLLIQFDPLGFQLTLADLLGV
jgi:hypothetical protein